MLLDRQSADDAHVLVLRGRVAASDAPSLHAAVTDALSTAPRGVVIDLTGADAVDAAALDALAAAASRAGAWPRPSLAVSGAPSSVRSGLAPLLSLHDDVRGALAHLDDHGTGESFREVVVEHGPQGPRQARRAVLEWAGDIGLGAPADDLLLVVSELVTNAVRYGSPPVTVAVSADDRTITVGVVDAASARPARRSSSDVDENGRGLLLLSMLSTEHGVRPDPPGKVVWACLPRS